VASKQHQVGDGSRSESTGYLPLVLRITWMMIGNLGLFICAVLIAQGVAPVVTDLLLFLVAGGLITVRYVDITRCEGQTSEGEPATLAHWRRYAGGMLLTSGAMWAAARFVALRGWM